MGEAGERGVPLTMTSAGPSCRTVGPQAGYPVSSSAYFSNGSFADARMRFSSVRHVDRSSAMILPMAAVA